VYSQLAHYILQAVNKRRTEEKLKESEKTYRLLTENTTDVIFIQNLDFSIRYVSPSVEALSGYTPEEIIKMKPEEFIAPTSYERAVRTWKEALSTADNQPEDDIRLMQYEYVRKDGSKLWGELRVKLLRDSDGRVIGTQGTLRDITERKRTEEKLKKSEEMYRLLTENITDAVFIQDMNLQVIFVSPSIETLSGYTPEEVIQLKTQDFMTPESFKRGVVDFKNAISLAMQGRDNEIPLVQYEYVRKDGTTFWGELRTKMLRDSAGNLSGIQGTLRDITERKKTEEKLKENDEMYKLLTQHASDVLFVQNLDLSIKYISPSVETLSGYTPEEVIALGPKFLMTDESYERGAVEFEKAVELATKNPDIDFPYWRYEYLRKDGSRAWGEFKAKFLRDSDGNVVAMQGILRDITERKRAEDALRQEREMLELVTSNINAGLTIISRDYKVLWANKFLRTVFGDVTGKTCYSLYNDRTDVCPGCGVKEIFETGKNHVVHEHFVPAQNGQRTWVELTTNPIRDEKGNIIAVSELSVFLDERKEMENKLHEAEKRYRILFDKAPLVLLILDSDGRIVDFNDEAHRQLGYSREELGKLTVSDIEVMDTPDDIEERIKRIVETGMEEFETKHRTKNREIRDVINIIRSVELDGKRFFLIIKRDITERKMTENQLKEMMRELQLVNEKLSVVGKLTRHDARNKLSVIANQVYLIKQRLGKDYDAECLESIESAIDQIGKIFWFAKTYELLGSKELSYINVNDCVNEAAMMFSDLDQIKLVNDCSGLSVLSDSLLRQLFYNLIDNSLKYGEKVSQVRTFYVEEADHVNLVYEDDGVGLPDAEKERIFLEHYGKGTGYGLYLIRKMCEVYGWTIKETGVYGKGAQFTMSIPKLGKTKKQSYMIVSS
jgi:PAS domain S-box-containing protein